MSEMSFKSYLFTITRNKTINFPVKVKKILHKLLKIT